MKKLRQVFFIIGLTVGITFIMDRSIYLVISKMSNSVLSGQSVGKFNHYLQIKDSLEIAVFGSSRANHHIDPEYNSSLGFNIGVDGSKIGLSSTMIQLLPLNKKQLVILHLDPEKVFDLEYSGSDINFLNSFYNKDEVVKKAIDKYSSGYVLNSIMHTLDYNGKVLGIVKNYLKPKYDHKKYNGYDEIKSSKNQTKIFEKYLEDFSNIPCLDNYIINPIVARELYSVIRFCAENSKQLIVVTTPKYIDACSKDNELLKEYLRNLGVQYLDFTNSLPERNIDLWKDRTHLNSNGALKFNSIFWDQIKIN